MCVLLFASDRLETQGIIELHVDDMLLGGTELLHKMIVEPLREKYPFKHVKAGNGEFLGRMITQQEDWSVILSRAIMPARLTASRFLEKEEDSVRVA